MNVEFILACWAAFWICLIAALLYVNAGETRRQAEERDRRRLRNEVLNYRRHDWHGDAE
jgi:hypothetical protein